MRRIALFLALATAPLAAHAQAPAAARNSLVSDIYDQNVYDKGQNKIGKIDNLVVDSAGNITTAVIGVGGFLGAGEKDVGIPFTDIKWVAKDGKNWLQLDRTKDQLKAAQPFDTKPMKK